MTVPSVRAYRDGVHFVYRSHYEGPLSRHVVRLPDRTVLGWFQRGWAADADPQAWVEAELDRDVYGLDSIFRAARKKSLPRPETTDELRALLHEHLYVEGDEDHIRLDEHSLRVRTDDDEVELAYFFFDDDDAPPDRLAYLLHETWPLPSNAGGGVAPFAAGVPVLTVTEPGQADTTTFAVFLTFYDGESLAIAPPLAFPGVGLGSLGAHLRGAEPESDWPLELRVLRAFTAPGEPGVGAALERCNRWPGFNLNSDTEVPDGPVDPGGEFTSGRDPDASLLQVDEHIAQLAMHISEFFGYQQWFLFDTVWAAAHPDLARSLLRYAHHWDPLGHDDSAN